MLLPYDLRDWVADDDFVHFIIEAVESIPLDTFLFNRRGTGSDGYHPHVMLTLLIYCYANGVFSSRKIEQASYRDISVRYILSNTHPDHSTISKFRKENVDAIAASFLQVLKLARELKILKVGTISVDGTKMKASASKNQNIRYDRAQELDKQLETDINELLKKAADADKREGVEEESLPEEIHRREKLRAKLQDAQRKIEEREKKRYEKEKAEYDQKIKDEEDDTKPPRRGRKPKVPSPEVRPDIQQNLTDGDSRLMCKNSRSGFEQSYNAQAAVDADGTMLILGNYVTSNSNDKKELKHCIESVTLNEGEAIATVLADAGYGSEVGVKDIQKRGIATLVSVHAGGREEGRHYDFRPKREKKQIKESKQWVKDMEATLDIPENKTLYRKRQQTVEPVFGIIKQALGFRQFLTRGLENVTNEWNLVSTAYNFKRLFVLK